MKKSNTGLILAAFLIGGPLYLVMNHPIIFWLVFVPLVVIGIISFISWLRK